MTNPTSSFGDQVQPFQIEGLGLRGRLVRLSDAYKLAAEGHVYPASVSELVGQSMTLSVILSSALKYDGIFTLQTQSDGAVYILTADITSEGHIRACARYDSVAVAKADAANGADIPRLLGTGHLVFTVDQGPDMERYQGITALEGATLSECAQSYFQQSEQLETAIFLVADPGTYRAAALMIQRLPANEEGTDARDIDDENWRHAVVLMSSITKDELLSDDLTPSDILYRLYHEDGVRLYEPKQLEHKCRCSLGKVESTLKSFPMQEILDMAEEDGSIVTTCEFCTARYHFDKAKLDELLS